MRKPLLLMVLIVAIGLLVVGCAGGQQQPAVVTQVVEKVATQIIEVEKTTVVEQVVTATPAPEQPATFSAADKETFVTVEIGDPETLDPALSYETSGAEIIQQVYETLVFYNKGNPTEFVPQLAESWEVSDDGLTYTFKIREGVKFHDGADMTASDVAYSFQRGLLQGGSASPQWLLTEPFLGVGIHDVTDLIDPEGNLLDNPEGLQSADAAKVQEVCEKVTSAIVADDEAGTVTMKLAQPWGPFLPTIAQTWGSVMDKDWTVENGGWDGDCATWTKFYGVTSENDPLNTIMNGTGPYKFDHWTPGEEVVLVANEEYWRTEPAWEGGPTGAPRLKRLVLRSVDEWGTRFAMAQAGDADHIYVPIENRPQVDPLVGEICSVAEDGTPTNCQPTENPDAPLRMYRDLLPTDRTDAFFTFNVNTEGGNNFIGSGQLDGNGIPPDFFSDIHVRKAFNYCFDWETYIQDVYQGEAVQVSGFINPGLIGYDENGPKYTYDPDQCKAEIEQAWDGQVAQNGFRFQIAYNTGNTTRQTVAEILQANFAAIDEKYQIEVIGLPWPNFLRQQRESRLPIFVSGWLEDIHDPHNWAQPFTVGTYGGRQQLPDELKAQFEELLNQAVAETDPEKRAELYKQMTQIDYDNAIAIRLAVGTGRRYFQRWVDGWYYNPIYPGLVGYYYALEKK